MAETHKMNEKRTKHKSSNAQKIVRKKKEIKPKGKRVGK